MSHSGKDRQSGGKTEAITVRELPPNPFARWPMRLAVHAFAAVTLLVSVILAMSEDSFLPLLLGFLVLAAVQGVWLYFHLRR